MKTTKIKKKKKPKHSNEERSRSSKRERFCLGHRTQQNTVKKRKVLFY